MTQKSCLTCRYWSKNAPRPDVNWGTCAKLLTGSIADSLVLIQHIQSPAVVYTRDIFYCAMFEQREAHDAR